jgi:hypothetical protein
VAAGRFLELATGAFEIDTLAVPEIPNGGVHRLRPRA